MSGFTSGDYAYLKHLLMTKPDDTKALLSNNFNIILGALEIAAAHDSPRTAEPEGDGDRTVHPSLEDEKQREVDRIVQASLATVPATELLRRVTELEKLVNDTTAYLVNPSGSKIRELARSRDRWMKTRVECF